MEEEVIKDAVEKIISEECYIRWAYDDPDIGGTYTAADKIAKYIHSLLKTK